LDISLTQTVRALGKLLLRPLLRNFYRVTLDVLRCVTGISPPNSVTLTALSVVLLLVLDLHLGLLLSSIPTSVLYSGLW